MTPNLLEEVLAPRLPDLPGKLFYNFSLDVIDRVPQVVISISERIFNHNNTESHLEILFAGTIELSLAFYIVSPPERDDVTVPYYVFPDTVEQAPSNLILEDIEDAVDKLYSSFSMFVNLLQGVTSF